MRSFWLRRATSLSISNARHSCLRDVGPSTLVRAVRAPADSGLERPEWLARTLAAGALVASLGLASRATAREHVATPGETLWEIARAHGCTVESLREANDMRSEDPLIVGDRLKIPACRGKSKGATAAEGSTRYEVRAGDTLGHIAHRFGTTVADIQRRNRLTGTTIRPGQELVVEGEAPLPLRVVEGQSLGHPVRGKLVGGAQLPHDRAYYRRRPEWAYGAQHVVDHTRRAIAQVRRVFPSIHRLAIGDISAPSGGSIPGHSSHQSGRDVDLGLYFERPPQGYPEEFVKADEGKLHLAATWTLVRAFWKASKLPGGPEKIFLDYGVQGMLYRHARKQGVSKKVLAQIFQFPDSRWARHRLVKHEPKHADHIHVRFRCPPKDRRCR